MKKQSNITEKSIKEFQQYLIDDEKAELTIYKYIREINELSNYLSGKQLSKERILAYREYLQSKNQVRTVNSKLSAVNSYLEFTCQGHCKVKLLKIQRCSFTSEERELLEKEYRRLLAIAEEQGNRRLYLLLMTLCATGLRVSELSFVTIEALATGRVNICLKGKNRIVILPKQLINHLAIYAREKGIQSGPVFCTRTGRPLDRSNICRDMKKLCSLANVDIRKVFPHNLRHLFARTYYNLEKNLSHLADILGHSSIETTRIYVATSAREHEKILNRMQLLS